MKRSRLIVQIIIGLLAVLMIVGIVLLILDENTNAKSTTYEIIAFVVGMAGMLMATLSEFDANKQERQNNQMAREIKELIEAEVEDTKLLNKILKELDTKSKKKRK